MVVPAPFASVATVVETVTTFVATEKRAPSTVDLVSVREISPLGALLDKATATRLGER
jgi:hypothetical protein